MRIVDLIRKRFPVGTTVRIYPSGMTNSPPHEVYVRDIITEGGLVVFVGPDGDKTALYPDMKITVPGKSE